MLVLFRFSVAWIFHSSRWKVCQSFAQEREAMGLQGGDMKRIVLLLVLLGGILAGSQAQASSISYSATDFAASGAYDFVIPTFDTKLGTLQSVTFTVTDTVAYDSLRVANTVMPTIKNSNNALPYTYTLNYNILTTLGSDAIASHVFTPLVYSGSLIPGQSVSYADPAPLTLSTTMVLDSTYKNFSVFTDKSGSFTLTATPDFLATFTGNNKLTYTGNDQFTTTGTVTYSYKATPVPGAVWLLGSGLAGLVGFRRKFLS